MRLKQNPHHFLLLAGLLLVLLSFVLDQNKTVDIHVHDTYYVTAQQQVFLFFGLALCVVWLLYFFTAKIMFSKPLSWIHVLVTLLVPLMIYSYLNFGNDMTDITSRRYLDFSSWNHSYNQGMRWISYGILTLLLAQLLFILNLLAGMVKWLRCRFAK